MMGLVRKIRGRRGSDRVDFLYVSHCAHHRCQQVPGEVSTAISGEQRTCGAT